MPNFDVSTTPAGGTGEWGSGSGGEEEKRRKGEARGKKSEIRRQTSWGSPTSGIAPKVGETNHNPKSAI
jgi:hypothetical protein